MSFRIARFIVAIGAAVGAGGVAGSAQGQSVDVGDPVFQDFFRSTVCNSPASGSRFETLCLATRDPQKPGEDPSAYADISAASEYSLNPSQATVSASNALASARALAAETESKIEALRDVDAGKAGADKNDFAGFGPWSVFTNIDGEWFDQTRPMFANERGFDGRRYRGTLGADYRMSATSHIGALIQYDQYKMSFDGEPASVSFNPLPNAGGVRSKTFSTAVFASFMMSDNAWLDMSAGVGWSSNTFRRNAVFQPFFTPSLNVAVSTLGKADGRQVFASLGAGYDFNSGALSIGPYVRGRYVKSRVDAYIEQDLLNSGLAFAVGKQQATSLTAIAGVRSSYAIGASWGVIVPQLRLEYEHEFKDDARNTIIRFAQDPNDTILPFAMNDAPDRNYFNAGASIVFVLPGGVSPLIDYEGLVGYSGFSRHRLTLGFRLEF